MIQRELTAPQTEAVFEAFEKKGLQRPREGAPIATRSNPPPPPDPFPVNAYWWGWNFYISGNNITWLGSMIALGAAGLSALAGIISGIPVVNVFGWILAGYIFAEVAIIQAINSQNGGRGVYISMLWIASGIFVPTSA